MNSSNASRYFFGAWGRRWSVNSGPTCESHEITTACVGVTSAERAASMVSVMAHPQLCKENSGHFYTLGRTRRNERLWGIRTWTYSRFSVSLPLGEYRWQVLG